MCRKFEARAFLLKKQPDSSRFWSKGNDTPNKSEITMATVRVGVSSSIFIPF